MTFIAYWESETILMGAFISIKTVRITSNLAFCTEEYWDCQIFSIGLKYPDLKSVMSVVTSSYFGGTSRLKSEFSWSLD